MNNIIDFSSVKNVEASKVGWKIYNLLRTCGCLEECRWRDNYSIPDGVVVLSNIYEEIKDIVRDYYLDALYYLIEIDPGLLESIGKKLGKSIFVDQENDNIRISGDFEISINKRELKNVLDKIIDKNSVEQLFEQIGEEIEAVYKERKTPLINLPFYMADYIMVTGQKYEELYKKLLSKLSSYLEKIVKKVRDKFRDDFVYIRTSTYSIDIDNWMRFHTGRFLSIPYPVSDLTPEKIVKIYISLFDSATRITTVMKEFSNFSLSILVQKMPRNIIISSNTTVTKDITTGQYLVLIGYMEGISIPQESLKVLIRDKVINNMIHKNNDFFDESLNPLPKPQLRRIGKRYEGRVLDLSERTYREDENSSSLIFILSETSKNIDWEITSEIIDFPTEICNKIVETFVDLYTKFEEKIDGAGCLKVEFVVDRNNRVHIVQCNPGIKEVI